MNLIKKTLLLLTAALFAAPAVSAQSQGAREHRAVWLSPYLSNNWPSAALTTQDAVEQQRNIISGRMKKFKDQNINVVYFHVRAYCDALYKSSYEPWSAKIAGSRGATPVGDPLQILIEEAHASGIEVYAWFNPYRYSDNTSYGSGALEYENAHPDWLIKNQRQTILNPGLEPVKQRIVDIISEVVTNYDIDGVIFDDYFYPQGGMPAVDSQAEDYQTYLDSKSSLPIADWRRDQINQMVDRVGAAISKIKPYVAFGISPAGVSSPTGITEKYGLPPISGDWQYNQIFSDPLAWLKSGSLDFMAPQIYFPSRYNELCSWWTNATQHFNRHLYPSVDLSEITTVKTEEIMREALYTRGEAARDASGVGFFQYYQVVNHYEKIYDKRLSFADNFAIGVFTAKALSPLRPWRNVRNPRYVSDISLSGLTLSWKGEPGLRYTVYTIPAGAESTFACQREFLDGVSYSSTYELPKAKTSGYSYAVAVYDRYGNEYSPVFMGASATAGSAPQLSFPADGDTPGFIFEFKWNSTATRALVELADNPSFTNPLAAFEVEGNTVPVTDMPALTTGNKYYWRVTSLGTNQKEATSAVRSFIASNIGFISPANGATGIPYSNTRIEWQKGPQGTTYHLVLSTSENLASPVIDSTFTDVSAITIPEKVLRSGRKYYMQVAATNGSASSTSALHSFSTVDRKDYPAPTILNPATDGATIHSNQGIEVDKWDGLTQVIVSISTSSSFPTRSGTVNIPLTSFETETKDLGTVKISTKNLVDGNTYYVRARGSYSITTSSSTQYTAYSPVRTFVYSSAAGVNDITASQDNAPYIDARGLLHINRTNASQVDIHNLAGALVHTIKAPQSNTVDLTFLAPGAYIISVKGQTSVTLKYVK